MTVVDIMESKCRVCGIMVTYNPDIMALKRAIRSSHGEVDKLIIVDNASSVLSGNLIRDEVSSYNPKTPTGNSRQFIDVVWNPENLGVPTGINIGIKNAIELGFEFILILDQDSFVEKYL